MSQRLLAPHEPSPLEVFHGDDDVRYLLTVDHAGRRIPESLKELGLPESELSRHIAWDLGARGLAMHLSSKLRATCFAQRYSRLVIDCNRPKGVPSSIVTKSEDTTVLGNLEVDAESRLAREQEIFDPYHDAILAEVSRREARGQSPIVVTVHSFTPVYRGERREMDAGILYHPADTRLAMPLLEELRAEPGLLVGDNEPYSVSDDSDYGVLVYGQRRGHLNVELEVRQDWLADETGQERWALLLAKALETSLRKLGTSSRETS